MNERNFKIDVARGVAILFVILLDLNIRVPFQQTLLGSELPQTRYKVLFWSGAYGVSCLLSLLLGQFIARYYTHPLNKYGR